MNMSYQEPEHLDLYIDGLAQDCSNSIANALELLQSCTKPSTWYWLNTKQASNFINACMYRMRISELLYETKTMNAIMNRLSYITKLKKKKPIKKQDLPNILE